MNLNVLRYDINFTNRIQYYIANRLLWNVHLSPKDIYLQETYVSWLLRHFDRLDLKLDRFNGREVIRVDMLINYSLLPIRKLTETITEIYKQMSQAKRL